LGIFSGLLLAVLLMFSLSWSTVVSASDPDGRTRTVEPATLHKRAGNTLVFVADRRGRIWTIKGRLSDQTQIFNEKEEEISAKGLGLGSVWAINLQYPAQEGGLPVILEMKRIRPKAPE
jgi:hypothetical protein